MEEHVGASDEREVHGSGDLPGEFVEALSLPKELEAPQGSQEGQSGEEEHGRLSCPYIGSDFILAFLVLCKVERVK